MNGFLMEMDEPSVWCPAADDARSGFGDEIGVVVGDVGRDFVESGVGSVVGGFVVVGCVVVVVVFGGFVVVGCVVVVVGGGRFVESVVVGDFEVVEDVVSVEFVAVVVV